MDLASSFSYESTHVPSGDDGATTSATTTECPSGIVGGPIPEEADLHLINRLTLSPVCYPHDTCPIEINPENCICYVIEQTCKSSTTACDIDRMETILSDCRRYDQAEATRELGHQVEDLKTAQEEWI